VCAWRSVRAGSASSPRVDVSEHLSGPTYCDSRASRLGGGDNCHERGSDKYISQEVQVSVMKWQDSRLFGRSPRDCGPLPDSPSVNTYIGRFLRVLGSRSSLNRSPSYLPYYILEVE